MDQHPSRATERVPWVLSIPPRERQRAAYLWFVATTERITVMMDEFTCEARVRFRGKDLALNRIVARAELEDIMPPRHAIMDPLGMSQEMQSQERRRRLVDYIAGEFAHALTEALFAELRGR